MYNQRGRPEVIVEEDRCDAYQIEELLPPPRYYEDINTLYRHVTQPTFYDPKQRAWGFIPTCINYFTVVGEQGFKRAKHGWIDPRASGYEYEAQTLHRYGAAARDLVRQTYGKDPCSKQSSASPPSSIFAPFLRCTTT